MRRVVRVGLALAFCWVFAAWNERVVGEPSPKGITLSPLGVYTTSLFDEGAVEISTQSTQPTVRPYRLPLASCAFASCSRIGSVCASEMQASVMLWP